MVTWSLLYSHAYVNKNNNSDDCFKQDDLQNNAQIMASTVYDQHCECEHVSNNEEIFWYANSNQKFTDCVAEDRIWQF